MPVLPIIKVPDPVLREVARPVERVDDEVKALIANMLETMYRAPGVGLAAPQVGISRRIVVMDPADKDEGETPQPLALINPRIVKLGGEKGMHEEGCLSLPGVKVEIERPTSLVVEYIDRNGLPQTLETDGFLATIIQHELDHLDGKLIIDFLSRLRRDIIVRRFKKMARDEADKP
ncbi:MAG: peptide deformylase [Pseudomonadota bacterium]